MNGENLMTAMMHDCELNVSTVGTETKAFNGKTILEYSWSVLKDIGGYGSFTEIKSGKTTSVSLARAQAVNECENNRIRTNGGKPATIDSAPRYIHRGKADAEPEELPEEYDGYETDFDSVPEYNDAPDDSRLNVPIPDELPDFDEPEEPPTDVDYD